MSRALPTTEGEERGTGRDGSAEPGRSTQPGRGAGPGTVGRARRVAPLVLAAGLVVLLVVSVVVSVSIGQVDVPVGESFRILLRELTGTGGPGDPMAVDVIWSIRFPRVLLAAVVGAGLALCGTVMQATLQNPLADPFILGISSGASLGAAFAILVGFGAAGTAGAAAGLGVPFWAFAGALAAAGLVLVVGNAGSRASAVKLILAGTAVNALCGAASSALVYFANSAEGVRSVTFWTMGSLASAEWATLPAVSTVVLVVLVFFLFQSRVLNSLLMGDEAAVTLGIDPGLYRRIHLVLAAVVTGMLVATCGIIGFVGLIVPHVARSVIGPDHRGLLPVTVLFGALFLIWADVAARVVVPNAELPIGIVTSVLGAPLFLHMLIRKEYGFGDK
ncbi:MULTISPECIES: FecCD family ABC transporter permease [unclassified Streptomyces]|uniref:FecCD family ABC transporter permease n=1 Tax=unclassified Streptomyces TaxID=2593676 RepID=UPI0034124961